MQSTNIQLFVAVAVLGGAFVLLLALLILFIKKKRAVPPFLIGRAHCNPLIRPNDEEWASQGTFNPAAVVDDMGRVHLLYRALGGDGISRFGYASSANGIDFDDALPYPVFALSTPRIDVDPADRRYDRILYPSGGSWGGAEDPRMVAIGDDLHVTFNAFDSWESIRIGHISIKKDDFFNKRFKWSQPILISQKNERNKNWVLFPEKIAGKYAILHSVTPDILIDYVSRIEDLENGTKVIKSRNPSGGRKGHWDTHVRSAAAPPLKTPRGWLVFYHATTESESHKYKLGALLLDLKDPTKIIARSPAPVIVPDMWYENDWKPGIVYACGAVVRGKDLYIYYGGGDKYVCAAHAPLSPFLDWLTTHGKIKQK